MRSSRVEGGTVGLFPGSLLLKDMVTLVISLKVFFSSSFFFFMVGIEPRAPRSVKILYSLAVRNAVLL